MTEITKSYSPGRKTQLNRNNFKSTPCGRRQEMAKYGLNYGRNAILIVFWAITGTIDLMLRRRVFKWMEEATKLKIAVNYNFMGRRLFLKLVDNISFLSGISSIISVGNVHYFVFNTILSIISYRIISTMVDISEDVVLKTLVNSGEKRRINVYSSFSEVVKYCKSIQFIAIIALCKYEIFSILFIIDVIFLLLKSIKTEDLQLKHLIYMILGFILVTVFLLTEGEGKSENSDKLKLNMKLSAINSISNNIACEVINLNDVSSDTVRCKLEDINITRLRKLGEVLHDRISNQLNSAELNLQRRIGLLQTLFPDQSTGNLKIGMGLLNYTKNRWMFFKLNRFIKTDKLLIEELKDMKSRAESADCLIINVNKLCQDKQVYCLKLFESDKVMPYTSALVDRIFQVNLKFCIRYTFFEIINQSVGFISKKDKSAVFSKLIALSWFIKPIKNSAVLSLSELIAYYITPEINMDLRFISREFTDRCQRFSRHVFKLNHELAVRLGCPEMTLLSLALQSTPFIPDFLSFCQRRHFMTKVFGYIRLEKLMEKLVDFSKVVEVIFEKNFYYFIFKDLVMCRAPLAVSMKADELLLKIHSLVFDIIRPQVENIIHPKESSVAFSTGMGDLSNIILLIIMISFIAIRLLQNTKAAEPSLRIVQEKQTRVSFAWNEYKEELKNKMLPDLWLFFGIYIPFAVFLGAVLNTAKLLILFRCVSSVGVLILLRIMNSFFDKQVYKLFPTLSQNLYIKQFYGTTTGRVLAKRSLQTVGKWNLLSILITGYEHLDPHLKPSQI